MADNNLIADFATYRTYLTSTSTYKNTSGATRFFAYIGPNGKTLDNNVVELVTDSFVHQQGILAKQAINRDLAAGFVKLGKGVTFHTISGLTGTTAKSVTATSPGKVVGIWYKGATDAAAAGTITIASTEGNLVAGATAVPLAAAATDKVKEFTLVAAGQTIAANSVITATPASFGSNTGEVIVAIAYHSI